MKLIAKISQRVRGHTYTRSVLTLAGGTAIAQVVTIGVLPIITRIYGPDSFEILAVFSSLLQIFSVAACLRLETVIPIAETDSEAANLLALCIGSSFFAASFAAVFVAVCTWSDQAFIRPILPYVWLLPAGTLLAGLSISLRSWATRKRMFAAISRVRITQSLSASVTQLGMGLAGYVPLGLLVGNVLQSAAGVLRFSREVFARGFIRENGLSRAAMLSVGRKFRQVPTYSVPEVIFQVAALQVPIILISTLPVGPEAGFLALASRTLQVPLALIGASVAQVFASMVGEAYRGGRLDALALGTVEGFLRTAVGPMIFIAVIAPEVFAAIFGSAWARSGELVAWMTPLFIVHMMSASVGTVFYALERQRTASALHCFGFVFRVGSVWAVSIWAIEWVAVAYAVSGAIFYAMYLNAGLFLSGVKLRPVVLALGRAMWIIIAWIAIALIVKTFVGIWL